MSVETGPVLAGEFWEYLLSASRFMVILLSLMILIRCLRSMFNDRYESETWAYIRTGRESLPVRSWEAAIGRALSADVRLNNPAVQRIHAILKRDDGGRWHIHDVFSRKKIWVNGQEIGPEGTRIEDGDILNLNGFCVRFQEISQEQRHKLENRRAVAGSRVSPGLTLAELTMLQVFLVLQHAMTADTEYLSGIALSFLVLAALQWLLYNAMRLMNRTGFEPEILAFYLTSLGTSVAATSVPEDMLKQTILTLASVLMFLLWGLWLRKLHRTVTMRVPAAVLAMLLLCVNVVAGTTSNGASNWLIIGGISFQPSELVKVAYVYVGAATLDRLYRKKNLYSFILFSALCVIALALMGDFGAALIFFVSFLVIAFMRSGSIATVLLALSGAAMAAGLAVSVKPYIAQRFTSWGHAWEDVYGTGYQQVRTISAAASGGLLGKGAGAGWLKTVVFSNTDMVFGIVCEEQGLIVGICAIFAILALTIFVIRAARRGRSAYYAIAGCAAMTMMSVQMAMNVFGSLDMLPFTGVTFPFVSRGGTSLISCWMMLAYIKSMDTRRGSSFAVRPNWDVGRTQAPQVQPGGGAAR